MARRLRLLVSATRPAWSARRDLLRGDDVGHRNPLDSTHAVHHDLLVAHAEQLAEGISRLAGGDQVAHHHSCAGCRKADEAPWIALLRHDAILPEAPGCIAAGPMAARG